MLVEPVHNCLQCNVHVYLCSNLYVGNIQILLFWWVQITLLRFCCTLWDFSNINHSNIDAEQTVPNAYNFFSFYQKYNTTNRFYN
jgi:hypothetical protein